MNTYARKIALESGSIRISEIMAGDTIYCRHTGNNHEFKPSLITKTKSLFEGKIIQLTHENGVTTEHGFDTHARLV